MAHGYWGAPSLGCRCCSSGPKGKFWCRSCDHVCKAPNGSSPHCPLCRKPMLAMGQKWRPARKGKRCMPPSWQLPPVFLPPGQQLLARLEAARSR